MDQSDLGGRSATCFRERKSSRTNKGSHARTAANLFKKSWGSRMGGKGGEGKPATKAGTGDRLNAGRTSGGRPKCKAQKDR